MAVASLRARPQIRDVALTSLLLGLLADQVVRAPGRPGLNVAIWAVAGTLGLSLLSRPRETPVSRETWWLVGGAVAFAGLLALRDAEALAVFCLFSAIVLLGLAAGRGALAWARQAHIAEVAVAAVRIVALIALGPLGWKVGAARQPADPTPIGGRTWPRTARMVARGIVMALPPLLEHLFFIGLIAWFTSGYIRAFMVGDDAVMDLVRIPRPALAPSEITIAL